jgi:hypothetical protein
VLSGGGGADDFVFLRKDVGDGGKSLGRDTILDFDVKAGDRLMLHDLVKDVAKADVGKVLSLEDAKSGLVIVAEIDGEKLDVVLLEGLHGLSLKELIADGAIVL